MSDRSERAKAARQRAIDANSEAARATSSLRQQDLGRGQSYQSGTLVPLSKAFEPSLASSFRELHTDLNRICQEDWNSLARVGVGGHLRAGVPSSFSRILCLA